MKTFLLTITIIISLYATYTLSNYQDRMTQYNRHVCAVNGYQEDCTTDRTQPQTKCDNYYGSGMCDTNGEVYPEYTKQALEVEATK